MDESIDIMKGDKVVVLRGEYRGLRGTVDDIEGNSVRVVFLDRSALLQISQIQNFSAAARKAWQTRPYRSSGRPKDPALPPKRMISLRLDVGVWDELGKAVEAGMIRSREAAVNQWLRERLDELWKQGNNVGGDDKSAN